MPAASPQLKCRDNAGSGMPAKRWPDGILLLLPAATMAAGAMTAGRPTRHSSLVGGLPLTVDRTLPATQEAAS